MYKNIIRNWTNLNDLDSAVPSKSFKCGKCHALSTFHYNSKYIITCISESEDNLSHVVIFQCTNCTFLSINNVHTTVPISLIVNLDKYFLEILNKINDELLKKIIIEFQTSISCKSNSAATLLGRKILMHVAVDQGAEKNRNFVDYVEFIKKSGLIGKKWNPLIDKIRKLGNEENHEIKIATDEELLEMQRLIECLLRNIYEPDL